MNQPIWTLLALSFAVAVAGCGCKSGSGAAGEGPLISAPSELEPTAMSYESSLLNMGGTEVAVDVRRVRERPFTLELVGPASVVFEREVYDAADDAFFLRETDGERYDPPVPLLKFPMRAGQSWEWKGATLTGDIVHEAQADIHTATDDVLLSGKTEHDMIRVDVDLSIDSGVAGQPAKRRLQFWFAKGKGLVQRKFGDYSARFPRVK